MSYESFIKYFNKHIKINTAINIQNENSSNNRSPKILSISTKKGIGANITKIDEKDII
jgi:hypothetical protein